MSAQVQISVELLEKLAGRPRRQRGKQHQQQQHQQQLPGLPYGAFGRLPHHHPQQHAQLAAGEEQLQRSLEESRRVGDLLLKSADQELVAVQQQADQLLDKFKSQIRPLPCGAEQEAVLHCYKDNKQDVLACADLVDAYVACAQRSAGKVLS